MMMAAFSLTAVMGMSGLAVEIGTGYAAKVRNQRVADMAALGAALAYQKTESEDIAKRVAEDIVVANGLAANNATIAIAVPVKIDGTDAAKVQITTPVQIKIASLITKAASYNVTSSAAASFGGNAANAGCVTALSSSKKSIDMGGGASLTATGCTVASNGTISLTGGAKLSADQVVANDTSVGGGASITTTGGSGAVTKSNGAADSVKNQAGTMRALCYVNKLNGTTDSDYADGNTNCTNQLATPITVAKTGAADWNMNYSPASNVASYKNGNSYVVPSGTYTIGTLNISGGITVTFTGPTTLIIDNISLGGGSSLAIGDGSVKIAGTLTLSGGVTVTMGNGYHSFGGISVGGGSHLYTGTGSLNVTNDINVDGGGSEAEFAPSTGETVVIGNTKGTSISISGGSVVSFDRYGTNAATGGTEAAGPVGFSASGTIKSSGGSMIVFNKAAVHVIGGNLDLNGSSVLGSGLYVIGGDLSNNTGGTMTGKDVTFALGGSFTLAGGTSLDIAATSSATSGYGIQDVLVATKSTSSVTLGGGTNDKYSGVVYAPKAEIKLTGGASLSNNGSQCLMMVVDSVTISGGASFNTSHCASQTQDAGPGVALIQ